MSRCCRHECRLPAMFLRRAGTVWCCPVLNCGRLYRIVIVSAIADSWKEWAEVPWTPMEENRGPH